MRSSHVAIACTLLATASPALAGPLVGSYVYNYAHDGTLLSNARVITTTNETVASGFDVAGAQSSQKAQSDAWVSRIEVKSEVSSSTAKIIGGAASVFAINQQITGQPGALAHVSYTFALDGSFNPGSASSYGGTSPGALGWPQLLQFAILADLGEATGFAVVNTPFGDDLVFQSSNGNTSQLIPEGDPGFTDTESDGSYIGFGAACETPNFGTACFAAADFDEQFTISFNVNVGQKFWVAGITRAFTSGDAAFFNTAKLVRIDLAPQFDLIADDGGALIRAADGSFALAQAIPEPSTWAMMIAGFGLIGAASRRHQLRLRAG